ncbi:MAG: hypothetical protein ACPGR8_12925 [Limisphaerales bacterium]
MTIMFVVGFAGWGYLVYTKMMEGSESFWYQDPSGDTNLLSAFWHLINKSSGDENNRSYVVAASLPGVVLIIMLVAVSSMLTELYHTHGAHSSPDCIFPIARVDRNEYRHSPSDLLVGLTMFAQTATMVCGSAALVMPGAWGRLGAISMSYMFPAAAVSSIVHIRQYATTLDGTNELPVTLEADDVADKTGFDDFSTVVSIAYFAFIIGCAIFALAGLVKTLFPAGDTGGDGAAGVASWLGWFTGFATAATMMSVGMAVAFDSQIHDVKWVTGNNAATVRDMCHVSDDHMFAHFIFGGIGDESKLKIITMVAAFVSLFSVIWYMLAAVAMTFGLGDMIVQALIRFRGVNTAALYTSVALWSVVVFANALSPCFTIATTSTEDMFINLPLVLLACYYGSNVFRVATKLPTRSPFYTRMGDSKLYSHCDKLMM